MTTLTSPASFSRRKRLVLMSLFLAGLCLALLIPWWNRHVAERARRDRASAAKLAEAERSARAQESLNATRTAVEENPRDAQTQLQLALAYGSAGQKNQAAQHAAVAASLSPHDPQILLTAAGVEERVSRYDTAVTIYKRLLAQDPENVQARFGLANLYLSFDWPLEAEALLRSAVRAAPDNLDLKIALAFAAAQHDDFATAEPLLAEARRHGPQDVSLWGNMAHIYNLSRRYQEAADVARESLAQSPDDTEVLKEAGTAYLHLNDIANAMAPFRRIVALQPDSLIGHYDLALCYQRLNQEGPARTELETVLRLNPAFAQTRYLLGDLYVRTGRTSEGQRLLDEFRRAQPQLQAHTRADYLVSTNPRSVEAHWRMAQIYQQESDTPHMLVELNKTLELAPRHAQARRLLAVARQRAAAMAGP